MKVKLLCLLGLFFLTNFSSFSNEIENNNKNIKTELREVLADLKNDMSYKITDLKLMNKLETKVDGFNQQLILASAYDPIDLIDRIPYDLQSNVMTQKLQSAFNETVLMVERDSVVRKSEEWIKYKIKIDEYLTLRLNSKFKLSRVSLKNGEYNKSYYSLVKLIKENNSNRSVSEFITVNNLNMERIYAQLKTIDKNILETQPVIYDFSGDLKLYVSLFLCLTAAVLFAISFKRREQQEMETIPSADFKNETAENLKVFNFSDWNKSFEKSIEELGLELSFETQKSQDMQISLSRLSEASIGLQLAQNQAAFEKSLAKLSASSKEINKYFTDNKNQYGKKLMPVISLTLKLAEAIEENKKIIKEEPQETQLNKNESSKFAA